jgi:hypothetical protein
VEVLLIVEPQTQLTRLHRKHRHVESQLDLGVVLAPKHLMPRLTSVVDRYVEDVTPTKKGES